MKCLFCCCALLLAGTLPALSLSWDSDCSKEKGLISSTVFENAKAQNHWVAELKNKPNDQTTFLNAGLALRASKNYRQLDRMCKDAIKTHPTWPTPYYLLARAAEDQMDDQEALEYYRTAIRLKPCWANALVAYSRLLTAATEYKAGLDIANQGIARYKERQSADVQQIYQELLEAKGLALIGLNRGAEAVPILQEGLDLSPPSLKPIPRERLADALIQSRQWDKAIDALTLNLAGPRRDHFLYLKRAKCYAGKGQLDKAQADIKTFFVIMPQHIDNHETRVKMRRDGYLLSATIYDQFGKKDLAEKQRQLATKETEDLYYNAPFRAEKETRK